LDHSLQVAIIGGGIGGVTLARALWNKGISFRLFEQASQFKEVGAGIQITPNATKVLEELGLKEDLKSVGFLPRDRVGRNWDTGEQIYRLPLKEEVIKLYGANHYHLHRADLHDIIVKDLPKESISLSTKCVEIYWEREKPLIKFDDGSHFEADVVVGADGIHSITRNILWGKDDPVFTGHMCWRSIVPVESFPKEFVEPTTTNWMGPKAHVVTYYVKGGKGINIVAVKETNEKIKESWVEPSSTEELLQAYEGWHPNVIKLFKETKKSKVFKWGLYDRSPMEQWSRNSVTILGDAAHPMLPYLSQGAAMAIEDAYVLAESLNFFKKDINKALDAYETERRQRTAKVQLESRERGRIFHLQSKDAQKERDENIKSSKNHSNSTDIKSKWIYEYDARKIKNTLINKIN